MSAGSSRNASTIRGSCQSRWRRSIGRPWAMRPDGEPGRIRDDACGRRVLRENRRYLWPLVAALLLNLVVYGLVVYPLGVKSATAVDRAAAAADVRAAAERDMAAAAALVAGKSTAEKELATFYQKVLPPTLDAARRLTYAKLPALARKANVKFEERRSRDRPAAEELAPRTAPDAHRPRRRLRKPSSAALRARDDAGVPHRGRCVGDAARSEQTAHADTQRLDVLSTGGQWSLSAAASSGWRRWPSCWAACSTWRLRDGRSPPPGRPPSPTPASNGQTRTARNDRQAGGGGSAGRSSRRARRGQAEAGRGWKGSVPLQAEATAEARGDTAGNAL